MENPDQNINQTPTAAPAEQVPSASSPINPPTGQKSKFSLGVIIGIILFLLVAGSAAGFYVFKQQSSKIAVKPTPTSSQTIMPSPTPDPTASWKTINFQDLTLKTPNDWWNKEDNIGSISGMMINPTPLEGVRDWGSAITLTINKNSTINQLANTYKQSLGGEQKSFNQNSLSIAGKNAIKVDSVISNGFVGKDVHYENIYIQVGSDVYSFLSDDFRFGSTEKQNIYINQILSTFKFTNQTSALPTPESVVGWKPISLPFLTMQVPKEWDLWSCGNDLNVFMKNNPQSQAEVLANNCPFDGNAGELHISKSKTNYSSIDAAIPKSTSETFNNPEGPGTYTITSTVSEITNIEIDGKKAATWKTINKTSLPGGGQGDGTYGEAIILPNINIDLMNYDNIQTFNKILTTVKIVN